MKVVPGANTMEHIIWFGAPGRLPERLPGREASGLPRGGKEPSHSTNLCEFLEVVGLALLNEFPSCMRACSGIKDGCHGSALLAGCALPSARAVRFQVPIFLHS